MGKYKVIPYLNGVNIFYLISNIKVLPTLLKGRKKELGLEDLYQTLSHHRANNLGTKLEKAWENELQEKRNQNKPPSLLRAGLKVFLFQSMLMGFALLAIEMLFKVTSPLLLGGIVRYYASGNNDENNISEAYIYAGFLIFCSYMNVVFAHGLMLAQLSLGMKMRISACSLIYRKSLRLSKSALINTTSGQVVNLLSNDVSRFELIAMFVHYLWVGPIETIVVGVLMYLEIGVSAIAGIIFLLLFIPFQCKHKYLFKSFSMTNAINHTQFILEKKHPNYV